MFQYECHGTYIHDFSRRGDLKRLMDLTDAEAEVLLRSSPFVKPYHHPEQGQALILNKGFCVVSRAEGRCLLVYNHDGKHSLWEGSWEFFSTHYGLVSP